MKKSLLPALGLAAAFALAAPLSANAASSKNKDMHPSMHHRHHHHHVVHHHHHHHHVAKKK
jgi:hypothetical protein